MNANPNLDGIARKYTAFASFNALLNAEGNYRPSLACKKRSGCGPKPNRMEFNMVVLADAYDRFQAQRGDTRRAYRF